MSPEQPEPVSPGSDPAERPRPAGAPDGRQLPGRYRTPRYTVFLGTGAFLGLAVGVALALYGGGDTVTSGAGVLGYFAAFGVITGALLGGTVAVVVESAMNRHHRSRSRRR